FTNMKDLLLSFMADGRKITLSDASLVSETREEGVTTADFIIEDFNLKITAYYEEIPEFEACEWFFRFTNIDTGDTPVFSKVLPCDMIFNLQPAGDREVEEGVATPNNATASDSKEKAYMKPYLKYAKGGYCTEEDFRPYVTPLEKHADFQLWAEGGRSSALFLPFFNLNLGDMGYMGSIGWTGDWECNWYRSNMPTHRLNFTMGMRETNFYLYPGESVRTPKMSFVEYKGNMREGQNKLRKFIGEYHNHILNRTGKNEMPLFCSYWGDTACDIHVKNATLMCENNVDFDYYWIDASWFGKDPAWMPCTGDWDYIKPDKYPEKFRPLTDRLHQYNKKFLLWFEPERVCKNTGFERLGDMLIDQPGDKVSPRKDNICLQDPRFPVKENFRNTFGYEEKLIDFANPKAVDWFIDYFSSFIKENNIDFYRNDANVAVDTFMKAKDTDKRVGIGEMKWVEGLYNFWDGLLDRCPNLLIDNCASGGRRMDIEMMDRSVPLWRTDYAGFVNARQNHSLGLNEWFANQGSSCGNLSKNHADNVEYNVVSGMTAGLTYTLFSTGDLEQPDPYTFDIDYNDVNNTVAKYRKIQPYFQMDYYPLTGYNVCDDAVVAYMFYDREEDRGMIVIITRENTHSKEMEFDLDFMPEKEYSPEYIFGEFPVTLKDRKLNVKFNVPHSATVVIF
ncbi:MAG: alpha-galactosidase, partial [Armatimonadetes bacterium]|nr:alpha-galactosidase [Candidatus Hippobium faecium]